MGRAEDPRRVAEGSVVLGPFLKEEKSSAYTCKTRMEGTLRSGLLAPTYDGNRHGKVGFQNQRMTNESESDK